MTETERCVLPGWMEPFVIGSRLKGRAVSVIGTVWFALKVGPRSKHSGDPPPKKSCKRYNDEWRTRFFGKIASVLFFYLRQSLFSWLTRHHQPLAVSLHSNMCAALSYCEPWACSDLSQRLAWTAKSQCANTTPSRTRTPHTAKLDSIHSSESSFDNFSWQTKINWLWVPDI